MPGNGRCDLTWPLGLKRRVHKHTTIIEALLSYTTEQLTLHFTFRLR